MDSIPIECKICFGAGRVVNLGGDLRGGVPSKMIEALCPACSGTRT